MSHFFDDEDVLHADDYEDFVIKKEKMNKASGIGSRYTKFNWVNLDVDYISGEEEVGISRKSYEVAKDDDEYSFYESYINSGKPRGFGWVREDMSIDLNINDEEEEDE